jgi:hypothetical protein
MLREPWGCCIAQSCTIDKQIAAARHRPELAKQPTHRMHCSISSMDYMSASTINPHVPLSAIAWMRRQLNNRSQGNHQRIGRTLEEGKFHLAFFDDRLAISDVYADDYMQRAGRIYFRPESATRWRLLCRAHLISFSLYFPPGQQKDRFQARRPGRSYSGRSHSYRRREVRLRPIRIGPYIGWPVCTIYCERHRP